MGCICSKGTKSHQHVRNNANEREGKSSVLRKRQGDTGGNETAWLVTDKIATVDPHTATSDEKEQNLVPNDQVADVQIQKLTSEWVRAGEARPQPKISGIFSMPNGEKGAQVVAGWPSWLVAVAGEAISGWLPRKAESFEKLEKIGQGTYSTVFKGRDLETNKIVALKKVRFANMDPESVRFMSREIIVLRRLDHPNVMKLECLITSRNSGGLYLVFEYMEHDLAGLGATQGIKFTEPQIKCYMQQLLWGLEHCHNHGVLHRDVKGSNLLIDNNGNLKIGDFGLATSFSTSQKQPLTSRVVTLWYRAPELLLGATEYGVSVDLWSAGCILAELFSGKPIMPGRTEVEQLHKIFKLCGSPSEVYWKTSKLPHATIFKPQHPYKRRLTETFKDFPSSALALLDVLLAVEPEKRGTSASALQSEFFTTNPLPCDPSSLPKYPPSKEFDAQIGEDPRRRKAAKGRSHATVKGASKDSKAFPAPDANAELETSIQKRQGQPNSSVSEQFKDKEERNYGLHPHRQRAMDAYSRSGQPVHPALSYASRNTNTNPESSHGTGCRKQRSGLHPGATQLSRFSSSVAARGTSKYDNISHHWQEDCFDSKYNVSDKRDWSDNKLARAESSYRNGPSAVKETPTGYAPKKQIHYSGPLVAVGEDLDRMLKEHEKRIQNAVRKARTDKNRKKS